MKSIKNNHFQDKKLYIHTDYKSKKEEVTPFYSLAALTEAPLSLLNEAWAFGLIKDHMSVIEYGTALFYLLRETEAML